MSTPFNTDTISKISDAIELGSISDNPQIALLNALNDDHFEEFKSILMGRLRKAVNVNYPYADRGDRTLLDIACSARGKHRYVELLLRNGADINRLNPSDRAAPIHLAVLYSDYDTLRVLTEYAATDIYLKNEEGKTALYLAAVHKKTDFITLLKGLQVTDVEQCKREILVTPDFKDDSSDIFEPHRRLQLHRRLWSMGGDSLAALLCQRRYEAFKSKANAENVQFVDSNLKYTYLQYACLFGYIEFVRLLLDLNVDPNQITDTKGNTPIRIATFHGYHNIVKVLLDTDKITFEFEYGQNIVHSITFGAYLYVKRRNLKPMSVLKDIELRSLDDGAPIDYIKCMKLILDYVPDSLLNVDRPNNNGNTPLGIACEINSSEIILLLLQRGAYLGSQCMNNYVAIQHITNATLQHLLNRSMAIQRSHLHGNRFVTFNYNLLTCSNHNQKTNQGYINETKLLVALGKRSVLKHPLFMVFLDFKWHILVRKYYWRNLAFYIQFISILSLYLLTVGYVEYGNSIFATDLIAVGCWYVTLFNNILVLIKRLTEDVIHLSNLIKKKFRLTYIVPENWTERILIVIIFVNLYVEIESSEGRALTAATAIIFAYVHLLLLILSHPRLSTQLEMFKITALNSCKFLMSYIILILAFAFSFSLLFKSTNSADKSFMNTNSTNMTYEHTNSTHESLKHTNSTHRPLNNLAGAVFKTLVMSMGEYELSKMTDNEFTINHLIMLLFLFMIPIVLFNLLNAIAVSDIQSIRSDAELYSIVARAKSTAQMEEIITGLLSFANRLANYYRALVGKEPILEKDDCLRHRYYLTNYFGVTSNSEIIYDEVHERCCTVNNRFDQDSIEFPVLSSTVNAIRDALFAEASNENKVDSGDTAENVTQKAATLQKLSESLVTLKNSLEDTDEKKQIVDQMITDIKKLLN